MTSIHIRTPALTVRAGHRALQRLRNQPLTPADVHIIPGAAGGPKALGISGLDKAVFGDWLPGAEQVRSLIGSSIGSWRFAAIASSDNPKAQLDKLVELYTEQRFDNKVTAEEVSRRSVLFLEELLGGREDHVLGHPWFRLNVMVVRSRGMLAHDTRGRLALGLTNAISANAVSRRLLGRYMERGILHDARLPPPVDELTDFPGFDAVLTPDNLLTALLASASIPTVMSGVHDIPGAPEGVYRDGGLLDYHLDLPYQQRGIVLYPHFTDRVIPGWFDKTLPWRRGSSRNLQDVLLVSPSPEYLASLPDGKLPDRKDFETYQGNDAGRERSWRKAVAESERLGDEFMELVTTGRLKDVVRPL